MRQVTRSMVLILLAALAACESVDDYVGKTIESFSGDTPPRTPPAATQARQDVQPAPKVEPTPGRTSSGTTPQAPDGTMTWIRTSASRLVLDLPSFWGGTVRRRLFTSADGRYVEEDARWAGPEPDPVSAAVLLSESSAGPPLTDAGDPMDVAHQWIRFRDRQSTFGDLTGSKNVLGPVRWRRARIGTSTCVLFLQRWGGGRPDAATTTLSGYYCAAPGEPLTPGEAETVVQSLGIRAPSG